MPQLVAIVWFPHSGCRWLNRSLLGNHSAISNTELFSPFLTQSTDMILNLDRTSQVHKSRSLPELKAEFELVKSSVDHARQEGIRNYFEQKLNATEPNKVCIGALSPGAPEPLTPDMETIHKAFPEIKIIHLVRNPIDCYLSMKSREEMDGDRFKIGPLWSGFNASIRNFGSQHPDNYYLLKYEDLKSSTGEELKKICDWIGLDYEENMLDSAKNYHGKNKNINLRDLLNKDELESLSSLVNTEALNYHYS